jgi:recombinational DNA repair protein (RecF pathway)
MPPQTLTTEGYLLRKKSDLESFHRYDVFASNNGLVHCLQRVSRRGTLKVQPDLFDLLDLDLEQTGGGPAWFIRDCRLIRRFSRLGKDYLALTEASRFSSVLLKNLIHTESFSPVYSLYRNALDSWEQGISPRAVYFKAVFRYARHEGYPVKEEWWGQLPENERAAAAAILSTPVKKLPRDLPEIANLVSLLQGWVTSRTDILL